MADRPTFVIAGAARSGTTALSLALDAHPAVHVSPRKEGCYFLLRERRWRFAGPGDDYLVRHGVHTDEAYRRQFAGADGAVAIGEASVYYLAEPWVFEAIAAELPGVRIIVILRDPAERAFSAWAHMVRDGRERLGFPEALDAEAQRRREGWEWSWRYRELGAYAGPVEVLRRVFDPGRVLFLRFDDLRDAPVATLDRCFAFLGVDRPSRPLTVPHVNPSGRSRLPVLTDALLGRRPPTSALAGLVPDTLRRRLFLRLQRWNTRPLDPPHPVLDELRRAYAPEVASVAALTGLDLSAWAPRTTGNGSQGDEHPSGR